MDIITSNPKPAMTLGLDLQVTRGRAQVQRSVGNYRQLYQASNCRIVDEWIELEPEGTWDSGDSETIRQLAIITSGGVECVLNPGVSEFRVQVSKMLVLDAPQASFTLKNAGLATVRVAIHMVTKKPEP